MKTNRNYSEISSEMLNLADNCVKNSTISPDLYVKYEVKRGLRDLNGKGVLTGLTDISEIRATKTVDDKTVPSEGSLFYRGISIESIIDGFVRGKRAGFEETVYLLLFGELPTFEEYEDFKKLLASYRSLPKNFVRDVILKAPSEDMMNTLAKSILSISSYDKNVSDLSISNVLRQCIQLIAQFPMLSVYGYQAFNHYLKGQSLIIHKPDSELSTAENILHMLRIDSEFTPLEAEVLDISLVLHAEHGGGNNSTFTTHVVTSSGTDTYSAITAALCSLKGPKHGGANVKVVQMFKDLKKVVRDWEDDEEIAAYLSALLDKKMFDNAGLIYGMGHAIYSVSDPRSVMLKKYVEKLSAEKGKANEYKLYTKVEELAPKVIAEKRKIYKGVSANVDFYSGFAYSLLNLPLQLYTPIFAIARVAGWSAHRLEELINAGKIIRPAYKSVCTERDYKDMADRG